MLHNFMKNDFYRNASIVTFATVGWVMGKSSVNCDSSRNNNNNNNNDNDNDNDNNCNGPDILNSRKSLSWAKWNYNWDLKEIENKSQKSSSVSSIKNPRRVTGNRHLLLIRHGQYDLNDPSYPLTKLGKEQAKITGKRLKKLIDPTSTKAPINIIGIHSSDMLRARQTAEIISKELPDIPLNKADSMLGEGIPINPEPPTYMAPYDTVFRDGARIEAAFRKYFYRPKMKKEIIMIPQKPQEEMIKETKTKDDEQDDKDNQMIQFILNKNKDKKDNDKDDDGKGLAKSGPISISKRSTTSSIKEQDEYEVIVCHGNVIRYFILRALQLPPEAWLRLAVWNCSITHILISPSGHVSLYQMGDTGHFEPDDVTYH